MSYTVITLPWFGSLGGLCVLTSDIVYSSLSMVDPNRQDN